MVHGVAIQIFSIFFFGGVADPNWILRSYRFPGAAKAGEHHHNPWTFAAHVPWMDATDDPRRDGGCGQSATSTWGFDMAWSGKKIGKMGKSFPKIQWFRSNHSFPLILMAFLGINCYFWHMAHPYLQHIFQVFGDERIVSGDPWSNGMPNSNR